jgi:hypothetical protein
MACNGVSILSPAARSSCEPGYELRQNTCLWCEIGTYNIDGVSACKQCPFGAVCAGGNVVLAQQGFWRAPDSPTAFFLCKPNTLNSCCPSGRCLKASTDLTPTFTRINASKLAASGIVFSTAECGIARSGLLCSYCDEGHSEWNDECVPCPYAANPVFLIVYIILVCLFLLLLLLYSCTRNFAAESGSFQVISDFVQSAGVMLVLPQSSVFSVISGLFTFDISVFSSSLSSRPVCLVNVSPMSKLFLKFFNVCVVFICLLGLFLVIYLQRHLRKKKQRTAPFWFMMWRLFFLSTVVVTGVTFQLLNCQRVGNHYVMVQSPASGRCFQGTHLLLSVFMVIFMAFVNALVPFFVRRIISSMGETELQLVHTEEGRRLCTIIVEESRAEIFRNALCGLWKDCGTRGVSDFGNNSAISPHSARLSQKRRLSTTISNAVNI